MQVSFKKDPVYVEFESEITAGRVSDHVGRITDIEHAT